MSMAVSSSRGWVRFSSISISFLPSGGNCRKLCRLWKSALDDLFRTTLIYFTSFLLPVHGTSVLPEAARLPRFGEKYAQYPRMLLFPCARSQSPLLFPCFYLTFFSSKKTLQLHCRVLPWRKLVYTCSMKLTNRECGIMQCLFCGMSNKEIAIHYKVSPSTIKTRLTILMGKIGSKNRWFLASWWWCYAVDGKNEPTYKTDKRISVNQFGSKNHRARKLNAPGRGVTQVEWEYVLEKHGRMCLKCGSKDKIHMDHVVPLSKGGAHDRDNVQPLCNKCNSRKHAKTVDYR
jgi:hypothetical protein